MSSVLEYHLLGYRRTWRSSLASSFLSPVLFLAAMGLGLGTYVDQGDSGTLGDVSYLSFIAPGLLAAFAMQTAAGECTWPVMGFIKWNRTYPGILATPVAVRQLVLGHLAFVALRLAQGAAVFLAVMAVFGAIESPAGIAALPVAVLCGLAFGAPIEAYAASMERETGFSGIFRFVVIPMFLFSGTFYPVEQLPSAVELVAYLTPLWHGVELSRRLSLGTAELWPSLAHVGYLAAWAVAGTAAAFATHRRRLVS